LATGFGNIGNTRPSSFNRASALMDFSFDIRCDAITFPQGGFETRPYKAEEVI
jgi:hypothetical protein